MAENIKTEYPFGNIGDEWSHEDAIKFLMAKIFTLTALCHQLTGEKVSQKQFIELIHSLQRDSIEMASNFMTKEEMVAIFDWVAERLDQKAEKRKSDIPKSEKKKDAFILLDGNS